MNKREFQLPYDRCIEIDQEVDALLEEEKKRQQLNERKAKLVEDSKKSRHFAIYKWLGQNLMLERVCGNILWFVLCVSTGFLIAIFDFGNDYKISTIVAPTIEELIRIKMLKKNYMIPTNVIDCPIVIKQKLYRMLDYNDCYIMNKGGDLVLCNADFEETTYVTYINKESPELGPFIDWDRECEDEVRHLLSQLQEGEYYSITDIITDKQVKYERGN